MFARLQSLQKLFDATNLCHARIRLAVMEPLFESTGVVYEAGGPLPLTGRGSTTRDDHRINLKEVSSRRPRGECGGY